MNANFRKKHGLSLRERVSLFVRKLWRFRADSHEGIETRSAASMRAKRVVLKKGKRFEI